MASGGSSTNPTTDSPGAKHHTIAEQKISDLLTYVPEFGVLICRACQFAVQPSAFSSHLLRHQIYRNERRRLLERLHSLAVAEPEEVDVPPPTSAPIPHLPVFHGLACSAPGCRHACVSEKRMAQHWSTVHDRPNAQDVQARTAYLQTFFRGNKNRYFEVSGAGGIAALSESDDSVSPGNAPEYRDILREYRKKGPGGHHHGHHQHHQHHASSASPNGAASPSEIMQHQMQLHNQQFQHQHTSGGSGGALQQQQPRLETMQMKLLYQWCFATHRTVKRGLGTDDFWVQDIVQEAFKYEYLMHGILSVAAYHVLRGTTDLSTRAQLHQTALQHHSAGLAEFRASLRRSSDLGEDGGSGGGGGKDNNSTALMAFAWILGVQRCAESQLDESDPAAEPSVELLFEIFFLIRGGMEVFLASQPRLPAGSQFLLPPPVIDALTDTTWRQRAEQARRDAGGVPTPPEAGQHAHAFHPLPPASSYPHLPPAVYARLSDMNAMIARYAPETDPRALDTVEDAILALLAAYERGHEAPETWALWNGVDAWPRALPTDVKEEFVRLIERRRPAALVVFAHWLLLVRKLESCYWFMEGAPSRLLRVILANLEEGELRRFVSELL